MNLKDWVDRFSNALCGKPARTVPVWCLRGIAFVGDALGSVGVSFPLSSYRLMNMITPNVINVDETLKITDKLPYTLDDGVRSTIEWLNTFGGCET